MNSKSRYKTKQQELIIEYMRSLNGSHTTAAEIVSHFKSGENPMGVATVYRNLDKLVEAGMVNRFQNDSGTSACYQFSGDCCIHENPHFHLKCVTCGKLIHMQCEFVKELSEHIGREHEFTFLPTRTIFYGKCKDCTGAELPSPKKPSKKKGCC